MKKSFCRLLSLVACMALIATLLCVSPASAEDFAFLGKPFPDFTATDTDGNTFTLSGALKDRQAVVINLWATWCGPCRNEFPFLEEAYEKYRDKVAFIALSVEDKDTLETIAAYRSEMKLTLPMGRDEGRRLYTSDYGVAVPCTHVVDRFGNSVYCSYGAFYDALELELVLDAILGDSYTETKAMKSSPRDASTRSFPVYATQAIYPDGGDYETVELRASENGGTFTGYLIPADSVRLRIDLTATDDVANIAYDDPVTEKTPVVQDLLDPARGAYFYEQLMPHEDDDQLYFHVQLFNRALPEYDMGEYASVILFRNEFGIEQLVEDSAEQGYTVTWDYVDNKAKADSTLQAYIVHIVDQDNRPVPEVTVNFCTDVACVPKESDDQGIVTFNGTPDVYHVQIIDVPEGFSYDETYEMYTAREYGEWILRVKKD